MSAEHVGGELECWHPNGGGYKTLSNHRRAQASMGLEDKLLSKLLGQFGQLLFYVHSKSCAEFTTKQNDLRLKVDTVQKQVWENVAFGIGFCGRSYRMGLARTRAETIHLMNTPVPPPTPLCAREVLCQSVNSRIGKSKLGTSIADILTLAVRMSMAD